MARVAGALVLSIAVILAAPARGHSAGPADELVYAVLPVTPEQARELVLLLRSPGTIAADLIDATGVIAEAAPALPAALLHDVLTTPIRDWHLLRGVVTDAIELVVRPTGTPDGVFRHTMGALYRSQVFTVTAGVVRRVTQPTNRTARLVLVLTARAHGLPMRAEDLDTLRRAIDRGDPDLGPLFRATVQNLVRMHGPDAVRLLLTLAH